MVFFWGGGWRKNEDASIGLKSLNDVLTKRLTGIYFVCLHVPSLKALIAIDLDGPPRSFVATYTANGRAKPSTIAIRNVYTRESHGREGLVGALVNVATSYWLKGIEGGKKTEVVRRTRQCG